MPPQPPAHDEPARDRHEALLRPEAAEVAQVRTLLGEIERRVFAVARPEAAPATQEDVAHAVTRLFGNG